MYNFLVTGMPDAWDEPGYEYDRSRILEYTNDEIAAHFRELKSHQLEALKKLPTLFAYEGTTHPVRVGRLKNVKSRGRVIFVEPEFDESVPPIPHAALEPVKKLLDIREWELNRTHWAVKDEDLLERLRSAQIIPPAAATSLQTARELPPIEESATVVHTVGQFVSAVLEISGSVNETFYRGHSNRAGYRLEPSVFRKSAKGNYLHLEAEHRLYGELLVSNPSDFVGDVYTLDKLVRMQHYSLPTRLLDITSNPLIALYFACKDAKQGLQGDEQAPEIQGEVIVFGIAQERIKLFDSDTASCLANLVRLSKAEKDSIDFGLNGSAFHSQPAVKRLLHFVKEEKPYFEPRIIPEDLRSVFCVKGKRSNDRISFQSGAFLLFGHDAVLDEAGTPEIKLTRMAVVNKPRLLQQLDQLNINERTVFPYIENSARYIAQKFAFREVNE